MKVPRAVVAAVPWPKLLPCQNRSPSSVLSAELILEQRGGARAGGVHEHVHDQSVLVDRGAAAVGRDAVVHDVADVAIEVAGHSITLASTPVDQRDAQVGAVAKRGLVVGRWPVGAGSRYCSGFADRGRRSPKSKSHWPVTVLCGMCAGMPAAVGSAQGHHFRIGEFAGADLDAVDPHLAAFILVAVAEQDGGRQQGAAGIVQALVGGPVVLLDAVHVLGDDRRIGGLVVGGDDAVPGAGGEGAACRCSRRALAEVAALPEQVAVVGVVQRVDLAATRRRPGPVVSTKTSMMRVYWLTVCRRRWGRCRGS